MTGTGARRPDRPARSPARPARPAPTRTAGSSASRAGSPPASGWAATTRAPIPGLQGGRAPARAFHDFMARAVANRPVEPFETEVQLPEWAVPSRTRRPGSRRRDNGLFVDPDGNPVPPRDRRAPPPPTRAASDERASPGRTTTGSTRNGIDRAIDRERPPPRREARERAGASRGRCRRSPGQRRVRPRRRSGGEAARERRSHSRAGFGSAPSSRSTRAWKSGPWFMWTRCATSWATVARRTQSGARISRQL